MTKVRLFPHRLADPSSIDLGAWWIERDGARSDLTSPLKGWDYARDEKIGLTVRKLDEELFLDSTGLQDISDVELVLLADCKDSQSRVASRRSLDSASLHDAGFSLILPRGTLAGSVSLRAIFRLARQLPQRADRSAHIRGARLFMSELTTITLEGDDSRFPTEPAAFSALHLPDAPWTLHITSDSLESSFMGAVRLLVNTEHPAGRMLLNSATAEKISPLAMADIIRLLVAYLADQSAQLNSVDFHEGSVVQVVDKMCTFFLGSGLTPAIQLYKHDPLHFDGLLHDRVDPLRGLLP
jgi:hypothetical protein